jgi:prepilin peptidase CpaA
MAHMHLLIQAVLLLIVIPAAVYDLRFRRIPNWLVLTGLGLGLGANAALGGLGGLRLAGGGFAVGFGVYFILYLLHAMGAGDAKLMAAVGSIVGASNWFGIFVATALIGGVFALVLLVLKRRLAATVWNVLYIVGEMIRFRAPYMKRPGLDVKNPQAVTLPHGFTIAVGCLIFLAAGGAALV